MAVARITLVVATLVLYVPALSQSEDEFVSRSGRVALMPIVQSWSLKDGLSFHETTVALTAYTPIGRNIGVSLRGCYAYASGEMTSLSGLSDAQLSLSYYLERAHVVLSCGVNIPSGRRELTSDEFTTSLLLSNQLFSMAVPNFGQGWAISPGVSWAFKLGEKFVLGLGGTYQYKGSYKPFTGLGEYDPAEEILLTAGCDIRLNESSTVSTDVLFTRHESDRFENAVVFVPGNKWVVSGRYRTYIGTRELAVVARYRTRAKSDIPIVEALMNKQENVSPDEVEILAEYATRLGSRVLLRCFAKGAFFENSSSSFSGVTLFTLGILPEVELSSTIRMPIQVKFAGGTQKSGRPLGCFEAGVGVSADF